MSECEKSKHQINATQIEDLVIIYQCLVFRIVKVWFLLKRFVPLLG